MAQQETNKRKYIPLNASESAVLQDADTLLPRDEIYEPLAEMIIQAVKKAEAASGRPLNELREHNAISIDGARGTGKTAVLLNLKKYLKEKDVLRDIHILEPVDPTLLEDGESLFLHIIVAAVLHDKDIKLKQQEHPEKARTLNQILDKLANAMESVETQKERHGIDKVRAMYSNKHLADCAQDFFKEALQLIGKQLLVLPIDDVDTSLDRAFENLEVVRRYLTTPYVLPIISGDRGLYNEVTWRDFHGRLTNDSAYYPQEAYKTALELAGEYQRKVLPFPRRLTMPPVSRYWQQNDIILRNGGNEVMPLKNFITWLEVFLAGPVNGLEGSRMKMPVPSIRALTQLINYSQSLILAIPESVKNAKNTMEIHRMCQMPRVPLTALTEFQDAYLKCYMNPTEDSNGKPKRNYDAAYKTFNEVLKQSGISKHVHDEDSNKFIEQLVDYFRFEPSAGAAYLILIAKQHWRNFDGRTNRRASIFDTPLFQPLTHIHKEFSVFDKNDSLSSWQSSLKTRLPEEWLASVATQPTILPYPLAEAGINSAVGWNYHDKIQQNTLDGLTAVNKNKAVFLIDLLAHKSFYTNAKQTILLNVGRIFEFIILSLAETATLEDFTNILNSAPFFSTSALAPTKTLRMDGNESSSGNTAEQPDDETSEDDVTDFRLDSINALFQEIIQWRQDHDVKNLNLSPWLVYKVFNKVYSQVASSDQFKQSMKTIDDALNIAAWVFYSTWSAFGSFEKGEIFGLPNLVATTNIDAKNLKNFINNDHYNMNLRPFGLSSSPDENRAAYGKSTRTISYCLAEHPLRIWIDEVIGFQWQEKDTKPPRKSMKPSSKSTKQSRNKAKEWLSEKLDIPYTTPLSVNLIREQLFSKSKNECDSLLNEMKEQFKSKSHETPIKLFQQAISTKWPDSN